MDRMKLAGLGVACAVAAATLIACGGGGSSSAEKSAAPSVPGTLAGDIGGPNTGPGSGATVVATEAGGSLIPPTEGASTPVPTIDPATRPHSTMAIDAVPDSPAVDSQVSARVGTDFKVAIVVESAGATYDGYQFDVQWDPAVVSYVSVQHLQPANLSTCSPTRTFEGDRVAAFCVDQQLTPVAFTGQLSIVTLHCTTAGTSVLHLRTPAEGNPGSKVEGLGTPNDHVLTLVDATVSCQ